MSERDSWTRGEGEDRPGWLEQYRLYVLAAAGVVIVIFVAAIWFAYDQGREGAGGEPPLVRASEGAYRHKPEEPGGMEVPDRDKLVYNRVNGSEGGEDIQLSPGPELPVEKPEPAVAPEPEPETVAPEPRQQATAPAPVADGDFLVQLGAFGSAEGADAAWRMMKEKHSGLAALKPDVDILPRQGQDPLYRLRAGPFASRDAADAVCAKLKATGQACFATAR